jgi:hypothetical protein
MHKKLEADLISLAHSILQMKNKEDVFALEEKAKVISSKLSMLAFVETYVNTTPNLKETKEELISKVDKAFDEKVLQTTVEEQTTVVHNLEDDYLEVPKEEEIEEILVDEFEESIEKVIEEIVEEEYLEVEKEEIAEQPFDELEEILFSSNIKDDVKDVKERKTPTLEEELKDTIPVDVMANLFEVAQPKSLNDALTSNIQIGLNDRITFVKNLFDGSQEDFNRVVSQLNSFKTEKEAKKFINKMVKPDYNWSDQEDLEARFMEIIQRKFV